MPRTYSELIKRDTLVGRFRYAMLEGSVGIATFGFDRHLNQQFYASREWKQARDVVITRDNGFDLGTEGFFIPEKVLVHHMNPIRPEDLKGDFNEDLLNPEYLICVSTQTHNAIHFSDENQLPRTLVERRPGDTTLW